MNMFTSSMMVTHVHPGIAANAVAAVRGVAIRAAVIWGTSLCSYSVLLWHFISV